MAILNLRIDNMHCGSCVRRVTQTLNAQPGTHAEEVRVGAARITGDIAASAATIALAAGIDEVQSHLLPVEKLTAIRTLQPSGHKVATVGDGINDAMASGSDLARAAGVLSRTSTSCSARSSPAPRWL
jgi:cation transport ATPase